METYNFLERENDSVTTYIIKKMIVDFIDELDF